MEKVCAKLRIRNELGRALLGEFVGTTIFVLIATSTIAQSVIPRPPINASFNSNIGISLGVAFGIAICAKTSGGHINPAVSLMFLTLRQITVVKFFFYTLVQVAGAFVGASLTYLVYRDALNTFDSGERQVYGNRATALIFASYSNTHLKALNGLIDQIFSTAIFCLFFAHVTDKRNRYPSWVQPLVIGAVFVMIGSAFAYNASYPCNPARDFGPRLFSFVIGYGIEVFAYKNYCWFWIPIFGPFIGAVLGAWIYELAIGIHVPKDEDYKSVPNQELQPLSITAEHNKTDQV